MNRYVKKISNPDHISEWKSKGFSDEVMKPPATTDNNLASTLNYVCKKIRKKIDGSCRKQDKITYNHGMIVNIYIVYELISTLTYFDPNLEN